LNAKNAIEIKLENGYSYTKRVLKGMPLTLPIVIEEYAEFCWCLYISMTLLVAWRKKPKEERNGL